MILTADLHLTDQPEDEYRWRIFDEILECAGDIQDGNLFILGDLADRKDRHAARLLNRMREQFKRLSSHGMVTHIIMGNHDVPMEGLPFWDVLNDIENVSFLSTPALFARHVWLLPWTANPAETWKYLDFSETRYCFIHQPITGAVTERGHVISDAADIDVIPRLNAKGLSIKIYAGDIHNPQKIGRVQYVGAPYPIDFGDDYPTRLTILNEYQEEWWPLYSIKKAVLELDSLGDLDHSHDLCEGDMAKVRMRIDPKRIGEWPQDKAEIRDWAARHGIKLAAIEARVEFQINKPQELLSAAADLTEIYHTFCKETGLAEQTIKVGLNILREED